QPLGPRPVEPTPVAVPPPARTPAGSDTGSHHNPAPVAFALLLILMLGVGIAYMGFTKDDDKGSSAAASSNAARHELNIFYVLDDKGAIEGTGQGTPCKGKDAFADLNTGAKITLKDSDGKTMATGALPQGSIQADTCVWHFVVHGLPEMPSYSVTVSNHGTETLQLADLQGRNWATQIVAKKG